MEYSPKNYSFEDLRGMMADLILSQKETEKLLSEKFQETDKKVKELANLFTTQWGKLVEALVEPSCLRLFLCARHGGIFPPMQNGQSLKII